MLQERVAAPHPPAPPRPRKRRRTATQVLAGYFDSPDLSRDFFTDMANTDETIRAVNSIIARNSSLLIDPRFQHIGPLKTQSQSHNNRHHRSLTIRLPSNNVSDAAAAASTSQRSREITQTSLDRRTKLMGRIQDISHLLLSPRYEREFMKDTTDSSLNLPPQPTPRANAQPDVLIPLSPQNSATVSTPSQGEDYSPRQLPLPELALEESQRRRQRSPDILLMEQDSAPINIGETHSPRHRRASFTASPPTPTRSITSLTSHTSSKWPHTPDNEAGPSFTELPASYADYASYRHEPSNADITIIQPQSPPTSSWRHSPSAPSPKPPSAVEPPQWMMTHTQGMKQPQPQSTNKRSRGFSLDNILSPPAASDTCDSLYSRPVSVGNDDEPTAMEVDREGGGGDGRGDEIMEDVRIPFVGTPEREMSVGSDHPLQPRSRRRSKAMKIVESDEETEGERERIRKPEGWGLGQRPKPQHSSSRLTIRIRPLTTASTSSTTPKSVIKIPTGLVTSPAEIKENETNSSSALAPALTTADVTQVTTPSENHHHHQEHEQDPSDTLLPPLIPGKARKRKAPPARKGWKGWVEVEVDENHKPVKAFSLDDLPLGERRTRSGKQFDG